MMRLRGAPIVRFFLASIAAALFGCRPDLPLAVEHAGCAATLVPGQVCVLAVGRKLTLWVPKPPDTTVEISAGEQLIPGEGEAIDEGRRYTFEVPGEAERVEVVRRGPGTASAAWTLTVSPPREPKPDERDVQGEIKAKSGRTLAGDGTYELIQRLEILRARVSLQKLETLASSVPLPAESYFFLRYYRGLLADKERDFRTVLDEIGRSVRIARHVGDWQNQRVAEEKLALVLADLGRSREAVEAFSRLAENPLFPSVCHEGQFLNNWAWATLLAHEAGGDREVSNPVSPETLLDRAIEKFASRPDLCPANEIFNAGLNLVLAQIQAGQPALAAQALAAARKVKTKSTLFQHLWELDLEARIDLAHHRPHSALEVYRRLDRIAAAVGAPDGQLRAALGRAKAQAQLGDRAGALASLGEAEALLDGQSLRVPLHEGRATFFSQREGVASLEVQLLLDAGLDVEALAAARRARSRILSQLDLAERLASLSLGDRKRWGDEIASYTRARSAIDQAANEEWSLLSGEVSGQRAARENAAREAERQLEKALAILGPSRAKQQLAPVPAGDLLLAFHPLPGGSRGSSGEWVAFAADGVEIGVRRFSLVSALASDAALSQTILEPFRKQIVRAQKIRILPYGALRDVDFHSLPFGDDVLLASKPVIYGLDLPLTSGAPAAVQAQESGRRRVLIVANPSGNLPGTVAEADAVEREIRSWAPPREIVRLAGLAAKAPRVSLELPGVELFHFSGHGRFAGVGGSDSGLLLADGRHLTVGEVLVLARAPRVVILSGCETGRVTEGRVEGLGLANAFVLAGSRSVVTSVGRVGDRGAAPLFTELYRVWHGEPDLASAFQQALLAWRPGHPEEWKDFRLIEP